MSVEDLCAVPFWASFHQRSLQEWVAWGMNDSSPGQKTWLPLSDISNWIRLYRQESCFILFPKRWLMAMLRSPAWSQPLGFFEQNRSSAAARLMRYPRGQLLVWGISLIRFFFMTSEKYRFAKQSLGEQAFAQESRGFSIIWCPSLSLFRSPLHSRYSFTHLLSVRFFLSSPVFSLS